MKKIILSICTLCSLLALSKTFCVKLSVEQKMLKMLKTKDKNQIEQALSKKLKTKKTSEILRQYIKEGSLDGIQHTILYALQADKQLKYFHKFIYSAILHNKLEIVKYFIEKINVKIEMEDDWGTTPLSAASSRGRLKIIKYLIQKGAKINHAELSTGSTPLDICLNSLNRAIMLDDFPELNLTLYEDRTDPYAGTIENLTKTAKYLLEKGAKQYNTELTKKIKKLIGQENKKPLKKIISKIIINKDEFVSNNPKIKDTINVNGGGTISFLPGGGIIVSGIKTSGNLSISTGNFPF